MTLSSATHTSAEIPSNIYKPNAPLEARIVEQTRLTASDSPNDVRHIVFDIAESNLEYLEGQSIGVLPPGTDDAGKPHKLRLYSIASARQGDDGQGRTLSICVKRVVSVDPDSGREFRGVCSNFLCDLKLGDTARLTGPVGKAFLLPPLSDLPDANLIMVATGTGIAPFRAFLKRLESMKADGTKITGQSWLFFGAQTRRDYLYQNEMDACGRQDGCRVVTAFSREEKTADGSRLYVQHRLVEHGETLFNLLKQPNTYFYMCGLRGMETGIQEGLQETARRQGIVWPEFFETLKAEKRWHVEVY